MFICETCHKDSNCNHPMCLPVSFGKCEICKKVGVCHDCHNYKKSQQSDDIPKSERELGRKEVIDWINSHALSFSGGNFSREFRESDWQKQCKDWGI